MPGATAAIFAAGRKAGTAAEAVKARNAELKSQKEASDAKDRMLEAGAAGPAGPSPPSIAPLERLIAAQPAPKPRDRDTLAERLRDGTFQAVRRLPASGCL